MFVAGVVSSFCLYNVAARVDNERPHVDSNRSPSRDRSRQSICQIDATDGVAACENDSFGR